ncbi:unnamed protein product, partial [Coregonus sp. 'balchen']
MEEGYELDLTYVTERIIAVSFPRACSEEIYLHILKDVTRMLKSKHADNYLIINLSEKRHDLSKMNPKICTICKAMENWLNADPLHVVVIHCRVSTIIITLSSSPFHYLSVFFWPHLFHFTLTYLFKADFQDRAGGSTVAKMIAADQALDRFAMRKYYDDKVSALMTPSQK